jgi:hypothetical protein
MIDDIRCSCTPTWSHRGQTNNHISDRAQSSHHQDCRFEGGHQPTGPSGAHPPIAQMDSHTGTIGEAFRQPPNSRKKRLQNLCIVTPQIAALQESVVPVHVREGSRRSPGWSQRGRQKCPTPFTKSPLIFSPTRGKGGAPSTQVIPRAARRGAPKEKGKRGPAAATAAFFPLHVSE